MSFYEKEDIVQDALAIIHEKYKKVKFKKGLLPWAYSILDQVNKDWKKKNGRRYNIMKDNIDIINEIYGKTKSVEHEISYQELIGEIKKALRTLNKRETEIFNLKLEGYSGNEIQRQLGLKRSTLDSIVFRAIRKLRRILEKKGVL